MKKCFTICTSPEAYNTAANASRKYGQMLVQIIRGKGQTLLNKVMGPVGYIMHTESAGKNSSIGELKIIELDNVRVATDQALKDYFKSQEDQKMPELENKPKTD